jgi:hypothetical protein
MNDSLNIFTKQRHISPPVDIAGDVERAVMSHVLKGRPSRKPHRRRLVIAALGIIVAAILIGGVIWRDISPTIGAGERAGFEEHKIMLKDHVSIWLEPIENPENQR